MPRLSLNVTLARPGFALDVSCELALAGITGLFGPSGSGKTTLLRIIAGLEPAARGTVVFDDAVWQRDAARVPAHERRIGYVFQDGRLFRHLDVSGNLRFALQRATARTTGRAIGFDDVVAALDLKPLLTRSPSSLSGGEQQRIAIARALLTSPQLVLMDEPLSSLDIARKREILPLIEKLPAAFGLPVLYVTHNVDELARLARDVVVLKAGRAVGHGDVADILTRRDFRSLDADIEAGSVLRARVVDHRDGVATLAVGAQTLRVPMAAAPAGASRPIRIDARDVAIATVRPEHLSIRNVLAARIVDIEAAGELQVELLLDVEGEQLRARITREARDELELTEGRSVFALIKSVALESTQLG